MNKNRFRMRHKLRPNPLPYANVDQNEREAQWYRCANCGFMCSTQRDSESGRGDGCTTEETTLTPYSGIYRREGISEKPFSPYGFEVNGSYEIGTGIEYSALTATVQGGCPLCGTFNWRGSRK